MIQERVVKATLAREVMMSKQEFGFILRNSTTDTKFALRALIRKNTEGPKELHCV